MTRPVRLSVLLPLLAIGLAAAGGPAYAFHAKPPEQHESIQDQMRCNALAKQFDATASQREVLCRAGRYGEGADTLEKAVRMIGATPGR